MTEDDTVKTGTVRQADSLRPKAVDEFLDGHHHFLIPSFQRGYRWGDKQVRDLLDDMLSFVRAKSAVSYFLQPIVVRCMPDGVWEVLDGQQRLTTMLLVLKNLIPYLVSAHKSLDPAAGAGFLAARRPRVACGCL